MKKRISVKIYVGTIIGMLMVICLLIILLYRQKQTAGMMKTVVKKEEIINLDYQDNIAELPLLDYEGKEVTLEAGKPQIIWFLSVSCEACKRALEDYREMDAILAGDEVTLSIIWKDGISDDLLSDYEIKKENVYCLPDNIRLAASTPSMYLTDEEGTIQFVTLEMEQMITKFLDLNYVGEETLQKAADEYLLYTYSTQDKPMLVYFAMEGCPDCEAVTPLVTGDELNEKYEVVTLYKKDDTDQELTDRYGLLKNIYGIVWFPSFVILDGQRTIIGETPLEELEELLL